MNKRLITNTKTLVNNSKTAYEVVYYGVKHTHNGQLAQFVSDEGVNTIKQFLKTNFDYCGELSTAKREAIKELQNKLIKYMSKQTKTVTKKVKAKRVADVRKNVNAAKAAVSKVIKQQAADRAAKKKLLAKKVKAKKVAVKKKAVAKKKTAKVSIKDKYMKLYKIVSNYSENLMQDVYSVVYKKETLKRFVNENLANKFIEQEVLHRVNEHAIRTAKKNRAIAAELASEFA